LFILISHVMNLQAVISDKPVKLLSDIITTQTPLIGIEPSTILSFRDEYPELVENALINKAKELAKNSLMIDEFLVSEFEKGSFSENCGC